MTNTPAWQERAICATNDTTILNIFFHDDEDEVDYTEEAKRICSNCPVRRDCLQFALDNEERFGVWGGADETTRRWALSIDQYGKPIQRVRDMKCPYCDGTDISTIARRKVRTHLKCGTCQLAWWSRKMSNMIPLNQEDTSDDMDGTV